MSAVVSDATRTGMAAAFVGDIAGGSMELWDGTRPAALGTPAGSLRATLTLGSPAGTAVAGVVTIGAVTQNPALHTTGVPTFVRFKTSSGAVCCDVDIGSGAGNLQLAGSIVAGQAVAVSGITFTMPNA